MHNVPKYHKNNDYKNQFNGTVTEPHRNRKLIQFKHAQYCYHSDLIYTFCVNCKRYNYYSEYPGICVSEKKMIHEIKLFVNLFSINCFPLHFIFNVSAILSAICKDDIS